MVRPEKLEARLEEELFRKGVAHLHRGAPLLAPLAEYVRGHGGPVYAVPSGLGAHVPHRVPDARGPALEYPVLLDHAGGHDVYEAVAVITVVEIEVASNGGHPHAVPVAGYPGNHALEEIGRTCLLKGAGPPGIEVPHGPRPHGQYVPQYPANARGGALIGLYEGRVVVALHLEDSRQTVSNVHDTGVLAGALDDARPGGGKHLQVDPRGPVGAVLAPHYRKDPELDEVGLAAQDLDDTLELLGGKAVLLYYLFRYIHFQV